MNNAVTVENLIAGYKKPIISDVCFNVQSGKIMTLIGPNGSGKSTVLKTLSGYLKKLGGMVFLGGKNSDDIAESDKAKMLSVLLTERINPELMTCREIVETGRYPYTGHFGKLSEKDKEAVQSAIDLVEIGNLTECDFSAISDGQRQRVMLARAICQEPKILILDEPTSYLDIHYKIMFLETVRRLADEKDIAVIMSMHELDFAEKISDYTVCVKNGEITHSGKPCDVFKDDVISELFDIHDELYNKYLLS